MTKCVDVMATNLNIDQKLLVKAQKMAGLKTKKETVNLALKEFISRRNQLKIKDLFNTIEYDDDYDYKKLRNRNSNG